MALSDQLADLDTRAQDDLIRLRTYYEHTKHAWRLIPQLINDGIVIEFRDLNDVVVSEPNEIRGFAQTYVTGYLVDSVFEKSIAIFEDFIFELVSIWLADLPQRIPRKTRQITYEDVIEAADREAIIRHIIAREANELKYKRLQEWFDYIDKQFGVALPNAARIQFLAEIKAARDIIVHNRGVVNQIYMEKAGGPAAQGGAARYNIGDTIRIQEPYLNDSLNLIGVVIHDLAAAAIANVPALPTTAN